MMESIYYVITWLCHRQCAHCYEDRFHPYHGAELAEVTGESRENFRRIIDHFPDHMRYRVPEDTQPDGAVPEKIGRIILAGGEVLLPQIREPVLYPAIEQIVQKYQPVGGVKIAVQTTGDLVTPKIVEELLARGVWMISVSGMDDFHEGFTEARRAELTAKLTAMFEGAGMHRSGLRAGERKWHEEAGPVFSFFGATPDAWIGKIWPRGRAWANGLSKAKITDNFCNAWSGGLNFLNLGQAGSEVSVEPNGNVYPCCMKTKLPVGNLVEEPLMGILQSLVGHPVYEAIAMGHPERMGIQDGWSPERFIERARAKTVTGHAYQNLCIGCDRFHEEVLGPKLAELRRGRLAKRRANLTAG
ncbi:MAG TPA: radical SAM/SPASM domain-containing protein [Verrucomicrobiae bacterium]|nr:radical SAM/SPASM domain-containing protein [Verrucomicrobiae bacterium]